MSRISSDAMEDNWMALYAAILNPSITVDKVLLSYGLRENTKSAAGKREVHKAQRRQSA